MYSVYFCDTFGLVYWHVCFMSGIMHDAKLPKSVVLSLANGNVAMVVVGGC